MRLESNATEALQELKVLRTAKEKSEHQVEMLILQNDVLADKNALSFGADSTKTQMYQFHIKTTLVS